MAVRTGDKCHVWVQTPDGSVMEADAYSTEITVNMQYSGLVETELRFTSIGPTSFVLGSDYKKRINEMRRGPEWECVYCHRPNQRERETCASCGAVRPFIYD